jgi:choline-glycine betaine transporter
VCEGGRWCLWRVFGGLVLYIAFRVRMKYILELSNELYPILGTFAALTLLKRCVNMI